MWTEGWGFLCSGFSIGSFSVRILSRVFGTVRSDVRGVFWFVGTCEFNWFAGSGWTVVVRLDWRRSLWYLYWSLYDWILLSQVSSVSPD